MVIVYHTNIHMYICMYIYTIFYILHVIWVYVLYTHIDTYDQRQHRRTSLVISVSQFREVVVTCYTGAFLTPIPLVSVNLRAIIEPTDYPRIQMRVRRLIQGWLHRT